MITSLIRRLQTLFCSHRHRKLLGVHRDFESWERVGTYQCPTCYRRWVLPLRDETNVR